MSAPEKQHKILVVDDEQRIRRALSSILATRKYVVRAAESGEEAIDVAIDFGPDLIVLDLAMPGMSGLEVCQVLRQWYTGTILVLSIKNADTDKITALDLGADDYLTKPFSAGELLARVRALLRRLNPQLAPAAPIIVDDLEIDIPHRVVKRTGKEVDLTRIEFDILAYLAQNPDFVVTSNMLLDVVWGLEHDKDTQTLRVHISNLRRKIEPQPSVPRYILTESGVGFRFSTH